MRIHACFKKLGLYRWVEIDNIIDEVTIINEYKAAFGEVDVLFGVVQWNR